MLASALAEVDVDDPRFLPTFQNWLRTGVPEVSRHVREKMATSRGIQHVLAAGLDEFLRRHRPNRVQEVVLTGGGNNIPELVRRLRKALAPWNVSTFYLPKAGAPFDGARQVEIVPGVVRGASAVGGASVLFDLA